MSSDPQSYHFFTMFSRLPLVNTALHIGSNLYDNVKNYSPFLLNTLSTTEQIVIYIANTQSVIKVTQRLEKPLTFMDNCACGGLQMLEHKYPSIRMAPEELKEEAFNQMEVLKGMGFRKLDEVKHKICRHRRHGMEKMFILLEELLNSRASVYLDIIEKTVDEYLPSLEERFDDEIATKEQQKMFKRLAVIPSTVQERLVQRYDKMVFSITYNEYK